MIDEEGSPVIVNENDSTKNYPYTKKPLITSASQMSSPYSQNDYGYIDGGDLAAGVLIDGDRTTYWHSLWNSNYWNGNYPSGTHYFQVDMQDNLYDGVNLVFEFTRRETTSGYHTIEWSVRGTNIFDAEKVNCEELLYAYTPFNSNTETITSETFNNSGYKYLRFYSEKQYPTSLTFFHLSEFQIYAIRSNPVKEGYTFAGWFMENGDTIPELMPDHDLTVFAKFIPNSYTLTYLVDGEEYKTSTIVYGSEITPEEEPTKEGYTFSGWSEIPETMPAEDVVITGTFTINSYVLTYMVDNEVYKSYDVEYNSPIIAEPAPTKEGYTFSGWSEIPEIMPAHDVIVIGSFIENSYYTITYIVDGEEYKINTDIFV